ncbi:hypothetical protein R1flu_000576 [Riccia fluitans]|uniref:PDZ domain-containing protein n=1 Tax=Riccia fluitans TaxID=41844 RepID=A0ABD1Y176_9MARC
MASGRWASAMQRLHRLGRINGNYSKQVGGTLSYKIHSENSIDSLENVDETEGEDWSGSSRTHYRSSWIGPLPQLSPSTSPKNQENGQVVVETGGLSRLINLVAPRTHVCHMEAVKDASHQYSTTTSRDMYLTRLAIAYAAARVAPAVVNITFSIDGRRLYAGNGGSGFIISPDGIIVTKAHVIEDFISPCRLQILVTMQDGHTFRAEIVSYDFLADIAILKVQSSKPLPAVSFGSSGKLNLGEWVVALGSPFLMQNTVTAGIVSCVDGKSAEMGLRGVHANYIQTDAAMNQGNSGGPLLNLDGEVIGINTLKALDALKALDDGVSLAVPIDSALKIINQLKTRGRVLWLGMKMVELTKYGILQLKEEDPSFSDVTGGVLVHEVMFDSPEERAGVRPGDVVVQFNGQPVESIYQIGEALGDQEGVAYNLVVRRAKGETVTLSVTEEASPSI